MSARRKANPCPTCAARERERRARGPAKRRHPDRWAPSHAAHDYWTWRAAIGQARQYCVELRERLAWDFHEEKNRQDSILLFVGLIHTYRENARSALHRLREREALERRSRETDAAIARLRAKRGGA